MEVATIEQELRAAKNLGDYEAVDVLWVCLLKLANRMPGTNEHCRMLALVDRFRNNISIAHTTERDSSLYFHRKITGSSLTSRRYISMRARSSSLELTRMPRRSVLAILPKKDSIRFSHEPCVGVKTNSKRLGTVVK